MGERSSMICGTTEEESAFGERRNIKHNRREAIYFCNNLRSLYFFAPPPRAALYYAMYLFDSTSVGRLHGPCSLNLFVQPTVEPIRWPGCKVKKISDNRSIFCSELFLSTDTTTYSIKNELNITEFFFFLVYLLIFCRFVNDIESGLRRAAAGFCVCCLFFCFCNFSFLELLSSCS